MVLHNEDIVLPAHEQSLSKMAAEIRRDGTGLPPHNWDLPLCKHIDIVEWKYYVREGRMQRSKINIFWSQSEKDGQRLSFQNQPEGSERWTSGHYVLEAETGFEFGAVARSDPLWGCVVTLITGFHGVRRRLSRDYKRCKVRVNNATSDPSEAVVLYDVILSATDGLLIVYGSNRPQDPVAYRQTDTGTSNGRPIYVQDEASQACTWAGMIYSIWFTQVFADRKDADKELPRQPPPLPVDKPQKLFSFISSSRSTPSSPSSSYSEDSTPDIPLAPQLDGLSFIIFRGLDNSRGLDIIAECYHKLKLSPEIDMIFVTYLDKWVKSLVFDILLMVPGIRSIQDMVSKYCNGLKFRFIKEIIVKYSKSGGPEGKMLPTVMLKLAETYLPIQSGGHSLIDQEF
ncbi:hypothetical protein TWF506_005557 [Arthrobotrys conoides]|uniref:Uncharacterized protein n=1 Tax=Arthrobotrys conoides TaxID=74498 RepID=A0AAN8S053_9PEZI